MLRADPRHDKALLLKFSVEINEVGEIRQIDTFLDKLTQLKQAYAVFKESVKTTMTEAHSSGTPGTQTGVKNPPFHQICVPPAHRPG